MFKPVRAISSFSTNDIAAAKAFYGDTLGLDVMENDMGFLNIELVGGMTLLIYSKDNHEPATFTVLNFLVPDVPAAVDDLVSRGITMERYDGMEQDDKGIAHGMGPEIAWFTDPAGNVIAVMADQV